MQFRLITSTSANTDLSRRGLSPSVRSQDILERVCYPEILQRCCVLFGPSETVVLSEMASFGVLHSAYVATR